MTLLANKKVVEPVSRLQGYMDSLGELLIAHLVDAQTYLRQVIPGVQLKGRTAHSMLGWSGGYPQQSCSQTFFQEIFQIWLNFSWKIPSLFFWESIAGWKCYLLQNIHNELCISCEAESDISKSV